MITLHAIWTQGALHLWGEDGSAPLAPAPDHSGNNGAPTDANPVRLHGAAAPPTDWPLAVREDTLRDVVGDAFDSLLASAAEGASLTLRLPCRDGRATGSRDPAPPVAGSALSLTTFHVPTLRFAPADAMDLLTALPPRVREGAEWGPALRYWSRMAGLVLELLARQRFLPAVHHVGGGMYEGHWRVVVDDEETSRRLIALIASMPPICRSTADGAEPPQASALAEEFLWVTVDALVRRCLTGDDLAHAIQDQPDERCSTPVWWLRSLVGSSAALAAPAEQRRFIHESVIAWLGRLGPRDTARACRTCFQLHAPVAHGDSLSAQPQGAWTLTLHLQATQDPRLVMDAARLNPEGNGDAMILKRPFDQAQQQLRADVARAVRHFPPLAPCAEPSGPWECRLTLDEAYTFLRDAAPLLESEGFGVFTPSWWREDGPHLRWWLDVSPLDGTTPGGPPAIGLDAIVTFDWRLAVGDEELSAEEVSHLAAVQGPLLWLRGRWTEVQASDLEAALRFMRRTRRGRMTLLQALRQCFLADDLNSGLPVAGLRPHGWIEAFVSASDHPEHVEHLAPPRQFRGTLRPYQLRGVEWLNFLTRLGLGACLADDMGLGKTIQLIALLLSERESAPSPGPTLLVVPMSLVGNWQREIERFAPSLRAMVHHGTERLTGREFIEEVAGYDVVISTYGLIHRDLEHLSAVDWHRVTLDEAQNIKNPAAKQAISIRSLRAVHRVALTGTPVENRLSELWSIVDFLNAGYLGSTSEFRRRFAVPIERYHDGDRAQRLRHLIRPFVLRRLKSDPRVQLDLPDKMEAKVFCNLTREQAALYEAVVTDMLGQIDRSGGIQRRGLILAALVKLKQICNHPAHFLADGSSLPHRSGKCDRLTEMLEEVLAEGDRALMFTQFRQMGALLQPHLAESLGCDVLFLHGGTTRKQRDAIVEQFQSHNAAAPLLILSLKAGGYGLNLTAATHVFHFDRWWNPAVEDQATDRAHRIGQTRRVQVHKFVCLGTLEERIDGLLERKRVLADNVVGQGEEWLTELSTEKLREVFALSREAVADD